MKAVMSKEIKVEKNAWIYLVNESRHQRGFEPMTDEVIEKRWNRIRTSENYAFLHNDSLGGGDGTKNGKWWGWTVENLIDMLEKAGFTYEFGKDIEYLT